MGHPEKYAEGIRSEVSSAKDRPVGAATPRDQVESHRAP
jgi:hypothetical protein